MAIEFIFVSIVSFISYYIFQRWLVNTEEFKRRHEKEGFLYLFSAGYSLHAKIPVAILLIFWIIFFIIMSLFMDRNDIIYAFFAGIVPVMVWYYWKYGIKKILKKNQ